jgi:hypothetical protein
MYARYRGGSSMPDQKHSDWIRKWLDVELSAGPAEISREERIQRLQSLASDAKRLGILDQISGSLREAAAATKSGGKDAGMALDALEQETAAAAEAGRDKIIAEIADKAVEAANIALSDGAKLESLLVCVQGAYDEAVDNLEAACETFAQTADVQDDERSKNPELQGAISDVAQFVPPIEALVSDLSAIIEALPAADAEEQERLKAQGLKSIEAYRAEVAEEPILTAMEATPAGTFAIHSAIVESLDAMAAGLAD